MNTQRHTASAGLPRVGAPRLRNVILLVVCFAFASPAAQADTVALDFSGGLLGFATSEFTQGWAFSTSNPLLLTQLGFWDGPLTSVGDGLANPYVVSVWTSTGMLLAQATVPAGTSATLVGGFRYVSLVSGVVLPAGFYTIAAHYPHRAQ